MIFNGEYVQDKLCLESLDASLQSSSCTRHVQVHNTCRYHAQCIQYVFKLGCVCRLFLHTAYEADPVYPFDLNSIWPSMEGWETIGPVPEEPSCCPPSSPVGRVLLSALLQEQILFAAVSCSRYSRCSFRLMTRVFRFIRLIQKAARRQGGKAVCPCKLAQVVNCKCHGISGYSGIFCTWKQSKCLSISYSN